MPTVMVITFKATADAPSVTEFLANFDGADGATSFTEASANAAVATFVGNAQLDDAQSKFGGSSLRVDGTGDRVTFPGISAYNLTTQPFTIEFWVRFNSLGFDSLFSQQDNVSALQPFRFEANDGLDTLGFSFGNVPSGTTTVNGTWNRSTGVWYHVAACRDEDDDLRMFVDGTQVGSTQDLSSITVESAAHDLVVGYQTNASATWHTDGWFDEMRIVVGTGLYTGNFTPPTEPFPVP